MWLERSKKMALTHDRAKLKELSIEKIGENICNIFQGYWFKNYTQLKYCPRNITFNFI